ncbi:MAG: 5'-nucleotidase C-terminal domain-containing protein [Bacteriovoracaceae bacterium]
MKLIGWHFLSLILCFTAHAYTKGKTYKITVLHTNDHHGRFWQNKDGELGLAARSTLIQQLKAKAKADGSHVLLLDAGDINTGIPQSDMLDAEPDFKGMSLLGYDVMALGNHEFDNNLSVIRQQQKWAGFPFISANIYHVKGPRVFPARVKKEIEDLKITIFGLTTEDTPLKAKPGNTKGLEFKKAVNEAKKIVPEYRKDSDVIIAVTHIGHYPNENQGADAPGDVTLARKVDGIHLIVGGHTQKPLFGPDIQNGSIIVQAYEWGKYVGKVDLEFTDGKVVLKDYKLIPVNLKDSGVRIPEDQKILTALKAFKDKGDKSLLIPLGKLDHDLNGKRELVRYQEAPLANFFTTAFRDKFNTDIAIINSGGIRETLYAGVVTYESVLTCLPFGGEIVIAEMSGKDLKKYLEHVVFELNPGSGSFAQIAGVEVLGKKETKQIVNLLINNRPLEENRIYSIALPEFIAIGGDKYPPVKFKKFGFTDAEIVKEYLLKIKDLKSENFKVKNYIKFQ